MSITVERVRKKLIASGRTQNEIAAGAQVSQSTISRILTGVGTEAPRITTIERLEAWADGLPKPRRKRKPQ